MKYRKIPRGAIKVWLPDMQQPDDYSCGAAAFMSVAVKYEVGPERLETFKERLKTNEVNGTYYKDIELYANEIGLQARVFQHVTRARLKKWLRKGIPVILSIQAWADDTGVYNDPGSNEDGHYVVAIGYDRDNVFYFMDPSIHGVLGYMSWKNLVKRWHENEGSDKREISNRLAIVIKPGVAGRSNHRRHRRARRLD